MLPNLPNALTLFRIALVPALVAALALPGEMARLVAAAIFAVAAVTDYADGMLARAMRQESHFGRMLDPIADKLLVAGALMMLVAEGTIAGASLVPALVILGREILLSGLREYLAALDVSVPVSRVAKWKTVLQFLAIGLLIPAGVLEARLPGLTQSALAGLWLAAALTLWTGLNYTLAALRHVDAADPPEWKG